MTVAGTAPARRLAAAAADGLADALSQGTLNTVSFADRSGKQGQRWWDGVVAGMGDQPPEVQVVEVVEVVEGAAARPGGCAS